MNHSSILDDLFRYNDWANGRIFQLCQGLTDEQLDEPREMGLGSLRNTLFHMLFAEEVWLERWTEAPWREFQFDAGGRPLSEIADRLSQVAASRRELIERDRISEWSRDCQYLDSKKNSYHNRLKDLLLHVANHGIHHRAQALNYLKSFGRTVPGGLDYFFYRLAWPSVKQEAETAEGMRQFGLEIESGSSGPVSWDAELVRDYFQYGDWANQLLLERIATLDDAALDRSWDMGMGTIRKTALHIADAERWWLRNWTTGTASFEKAPESTTIAELQGQWREITAERGAFLAAVDDVSAQRVITASFGKMSFRFPVIESMLQLCGHGTHHRAQLMNLLRRSQAPMPNIDYLFFVRAK